MYFGKRVTVAVPAFDEERLIERTIRSLPPEVDHVIVVDDASRDATVERAVALGDARVDVVRHAKNGGVGAAIVSGYKRFLEGEDDICVIMAGDAQMDPADLPNLVRPVAEGRAEYSKGNRLHTKDVLRVMPRERLLGNIVFTAITKWASGYWHVIDSQCGYTAVSRQALLDIDLDDVYRRYGFPNDFLIRLNVVQARVCDVPVRAIYADEESGINPWTAIPRISLLLVRGFMRRMVSRYVLREFHPLVLLYLFGTAVSVAGIGLGIRIVILRFLYESVATPATVILSALFMIVGFQSILFAMMFDMLHNADLAVRDRRP